ncbi:3-deoxy-7-phosphoheptulonate synthase [Desulfofundulus thermobenzoicus]|uniref:3-deoxy-7-phosphoheptulonate synthase n=1 Tax=Desulfofundulus thermobenzoicus TaxID=29376 RepID=A0A6N7INJ8_9FIRM|nr:3-deoxy-7-phosphoheptulonate synthase [Desulfofundulus thermobenzoicus]MQL51595.1 3-deoxy-7-phosphoheptulonate synthase [Desulfofundulus thermobenzoicus]HHW42970.1 3-deoxy-7-phosphoheptulonate synthase [Desulfotomaculum sp.]
MIVVMQQDATEEQINAVVARLDKNGFQVHLSRGVERTIIGAIGDRTRLQDEFLEAMAGVEKVMPVLQPYKLASRAFHPEDSVVMVGDLAIGGEEIHILAGPCAVESREQLLETARLVKGAGATILRGGAFKPRTSPYSFQGLEEEGLKLLAEAREETGLKIVTEVMDVRTLPLVAEYADILQIGARNMQNFFLLREVARVDKPVLLKRGLSATIEEWLMAAEYIMSGGNQRVILCERGIRTFETYTRNTLDLAAVPVVKYFSHLPVIVDPSHAIGKWRFVPAMARAAVAAGADGLLVEVHPNPAEALCDGPQSLTPENFAAMMADLRQTAPVVGRRLAGVAAGA